MATLCHAGRPPEELGVTHWSSRLLAGRLGISLSTVARIWRKWDIQPHRIETFDLTVWDITVVAAYGAGEGQSAHDELFVM